MANCSGSSPRPTMDSIRGSRVWICTPAITNRPACQHVSWHAAAIWSRARACGSNRAYPGRPDAPARPSDSVARAICRTNKAAASNRVAPARFCASVADRAASLTAARSSQQENSGTADNDPADVVIIATPAAHQ
ncbi:hypothetical protein GCM10022294_05550 [Dietzia aurantiaca]